ncbi:UDP-N-acetylmuramoyl-L-alanine--D-glutamate ligase [Luteipulveratus sp. YIM 133132]|uniref:UDP-N-acetylmuramoylalanine--D-glutamate ligase n=1 Tax=Luteipulveratus flavus TaxID=3031728 RepID=A0ABT6C5M1_9MICO|nr:MULTISPECIES: UDP-N-acetylmuramoyl-L-alanine--D-glutamate ligase [unclassified Luteipulveratus]MDE9366485.1 UDP-N-acetylmuramoyl-L-alanine--D-glutamate ligase [Luteipulveratus sp. YIM 133132]MDF8264241.1 UDP-N-acetylmuramoyl-L-alanine--D-glutamate ligase [Luteipulveratus sp. YIM 133296]
MSGADQLWPVDPSYEPLGGARDLTHRDADWSGLGVLVVGLGVSGFAAADALLERGARVTVVSPDTNPAIAERAQVLEVLGARVVAGEPLGDRAPEDTDLVVTSPGVPPTNPLLVACAQAGIPVWGEVELAWRMRPKEGAAPWLTVTGTNGKTTCVTMLESILLAAGLRATAAGNVGLPILEAVLHPEPYEVLAVELSTFQLHWSRSISPYAAVCLNVAPDHVDWHGSYEEYRRMKGRIYERAQVACLFNVQDPQTEQLVRDADVVEGCRAVGFTLGIPARSMLGLVEDVLADRAFVQQRQTSAAELCSLDDLATADGAPAPPHYVADALAAAGLARAYDVAPAAVREGLRAYAPQPHRVQPVGVVGDVRFVDDSKATNPPAARASLTAYEHVVWVAGGQLKGADVDDLVREVAARLRGAVLIGVDRQQIADALARHAPDVPVRQLSSTDTGVMDEVLREASALARPGDVVLLAPAAASKDMFPGYDMRGDAFAAAVRRLAESAGEPGS